MDLLIDLCNCTFFFRLFFACEGPRPSKMASHAETGAQAGMDAEFGPIPFSFLSTQPVHMTYEVQDYARQQAGHMPYINMNYLCSYFDPFFHQLWICFFIYEVAPFFAVFSLHARDHALRKLPLMVKRVR